MNVFNPAQFRAQFPALQDAGVYLDSAATALKPEAVVEASRQFYSLSAGNVHRSQFAEAQRLTARYEAAREKVAQLLNASDDKNIVWTRGTTESINMVAQCYARPRLQPGDEIIVSVAEHHANLVPWLMVAQQTGAKVVKLPLNAQRLPDVDLLPELITPRSRILALGQMSNVTGGCPDLARAITFAHSAGMVVVFSRQPCAASGDPVSLTGYRGFVCQYRTKNQHKRWHRLLISTRFRYSRATTLRKCLVRPALAQFLHSASYPTPGKCSGSRTHG